MERFGKLTLRIHDLNPKVALHHMVTVVRLRPFVDNLCKKPASDLDELRRRAAKFMQLEELREFQNQVRVEPQGEKVRVKDKQAPPPPFKRPKEARTPRLSSYTSLNTNRGQILEEAWNATSCLLQGGRQHCATQILPKLWAQHKGMCFPKG